MRRRDIIIATGAAALASAAWPARAEGLTLAELKKSGVLRIGVEATYVPFSYRKDGKIVGYDIELAALMCADLGIQPEMVDTAWAGVIPSLYAKKFDAIMTSLSYSKERMEKVGYSIPYAEASLAMLVRAADADKIKSPMDLSGKIVGLKLGSPSEQWAKKMEPEIKAAKGAGFGEIKTYNDDPSRYVALSQGRIDAVINSVVSLAMVAKDQPGAYAVVRGIGQDNWAGIAARKEDVELIAWMDAQLRRLKASGALATLQEKWFGYRMTLPDALPAL
jgi:polar amino acid transport system substrate-binding protein